VTPIVLHVTNHKHVTYRYILVYFSSIHLHIPCSSVVCKSLPFFVSLFLQVWEDDEGVCTPIYNCPTSPADQTFLIMKVSPIIQNVFLLDNIKDYPNNIQYNVPIFSKYICVSPIRSICYWL